LACCPKEENAAEYGSCKWFLNLSNWFLDSTDTPQQTGRSAGTQGIGIGIHRYIHIYIYGIYSIGIDILVGGLE
jgi:hypothetical protein